VNPRCRSLTAALLVLVGACASLSDEERARQSFCAFRDAYLRGDAEAVWAHLSTEVREAAELFHREVRTLEPDDYRLFYLLDNDTYTWEQLLAMSPAELTTARFEAAPLKLARWFEALGDLDVSGAGDWVTVSSVMFRRWRAIFNFVQEDGDFRLAEVYHIRIFGRPDLDLPASDMSRQYSESFRGPFREVVVRNDGAVFVDYVRVDRDELKTRLWALANEGESAEDPEEASRSNVYLLLEQRVPWRTAFSILSLAARAGIYRLSLGTRLPRIRDRSGIIQCWLPRERVAPGDVRLLIEIVGAGLDVATLRPVLSHYSGEHESGVVLLDLDPDLPVQCLVAVLDELMRASLTDVVFTVPETLRHESGIFVNGMNVSAVRASGPPPLLEPPPAASRILTRSRDR